MDGGCLCVSGRAFRGRLGAGARGYKQIREQLASFFREPEKEGESDRAREEETENELGESDWLKECAFGGFSESVCVWEGEKGRGGGSVIQSRQLEALKGHAQCRAEQPQC